MIATETSAISYSGNDSTATAYPIPFPFLEEADIQLSVTDSSGTVTPLSYGTDYTVTVTKDNNARITSGSLKTVAAYDSTNTVAIKRLTPLVQETDFVEGGRLSAEVLESSQDLVIMGLQEARRDTTNDGSTNVEATGTGLVAQTAAGVYATRTIAPGDGLAVTNGDGVSGNPTVSLDSSGLTTITTVANADKIRVETSSGIELITAANLVNRTFPLFKYEEIPQSVFSPSAGDDGGVSIADHFIKFTGTSTGSVDGVFVVPEDYNGGEITLKLHAFIFGGTSGDPFVIQVTAYNQTGDSIGSLVSPVTKATLTHDDSDSRSATLSLGSSFVAGQHYSLFIDRKSDDAADTTAGNAYIRSVRFQYPATRIAASW